MIGRRLLPILGGSRPGLAAAQARLVATPARHTARVRFQGHAAVQSGRTANVDSDNLWQIKFGTKPSNKRSPAHVDLSMPMKMEKNTGGQKRSTQLSRYPLHLEDKAPRQKSANSPSRKRVAGNSSRQRNADPRSKQRVTDPHPKERAAEAPSRYTASGRNATLDFEVETGDLDQLALPSEQEMKGIPATLLSDPLETLSKRLKKYKPNLLDIKCVRLPVYPKEYAVKVTARLAGHGEVTADYTASSQAPTRAAAENAAGLRLLAKLHEAGVIRAMWPNITVVDSSKNTDAIVDVYNYCASHLLIPEISNDAWSPPFEHKGHRARFQRCIIRLPEHGINVQGLTKSSKGSEIQAALNFKAAAEAYMSKSGTEQFIVKSGTGLSLDNAAKFHRWYKTIDRHYRFDVDIRSRKDEYIAQFRRSTKGTEGPLGPAVSSRKKKAAEDIALVYGAVTMCHADPSLAAKFGAAMKEGGGDIVSKASPMDMVVEDEAVTFMARTFGEARKMGLVEQDIELESVNDGPARQRAVHAKPILSEREKQRVSQSLADMYQRYLTSDGMAAMRKVRSELPMNQYKKEVFNLVHDNVYSVIIGATGSGKTTQVPQIILEQSYQSGNGADCQIICTQPRRIAATSVASRVADEMGPELGAAHVGHQVRFDSKPPKQLAGSVTYCTTGILLQQLQNEADVLFDRITHLIIDEVHERDKIIDFTLSILKKTIATRQARGLKVPHVTLMSATLDTELFANYFKNKGPQGVEVQAPILSVPGRTFPVTETFMDDILNDMRKSYSSRDLQIIDQDRFTSEYLESEARFAQSNPASGQMQVTEQETNVIDWKRKPTQDGEDNADEGMIPYGLIAATIAHVARTTTEGAILVFFPGLDEMQKVEKLLMAGPVLGVNLRDETRFRSYMLHSSIPDAQKTVFVAVPEGVRKIILSTNIAETSVTIPDVQHVIDTGKVRETKYDHVKRITALQSTWVSRSNAKQRAGRAGRVQNGHYLGLYSKARHESLRVIGLPELLRSDLQTTCLDIKSSIQGVDIREFLASAIEPPSPAGVDTAVRDLISLGALTPEERLTALGRLLGSLPIHPSLGKMIVLGVLFKCLDPILITGAASEERGLFIMAPAVKKQSMEFKKSFSGRSESDHLGLYHAFDAVRSKFRDYGEPAARDYAFKNNIHYGAWKSIFSSAKQMEEILGESGLIPKKKDKFILASNATEDSLLGGRDLNENSNNPNVVLAIMLAGMMPNISLLESGRRMWRTETYRNVLQPSGSVLSSNNSRNPILAAYTNLMKGSDGNSIYVRDQSVIASPITVGLFANKLKYERRILEINGWLPFFVKSKSFYAAEKIMHFRKVAQWVQNSAFADLSTGKPLHDDLRRAMFVDRIVDLIDRVSRNDWPQDYTNDLFRREFKARLQRREVRGPPSQSQPQRSEYEYDSPPPRSEIWRTPQKSSYDEWKSTALEMSSPRGDDNRSRERDYLPQYPTTVRPYTSTGRNGHNYNTNDSSELSRKSWQSSDRSARTDNDRRAYGGQRTYNDRSQSSERPRSSSTRGGYGRHFEERPRSGSTGRGYGRQSAGRS